MASLSSLTMMFISIILLGWCAHVSNGWFMSWGWSQCYEDPPIGCFPTSYPYNNTGGIGPQSPASINTHFYFYPDGDGDTEVITLGNAGQVLPRVFNPSVKTVVIIHGYMEDHERPWVGQMVTELRRKEPLNVVVVDWSGGAYSFFLQSTANTRVVGAVVALFLEELVSLGGHGSQFHLIGFSMGAHVAGYAGRRFPGIGRITGLDPPGVGFAYGPPEIRLDPTDANFVDVIHTDTAPTIGIGTLQPMGTVDFYPNGGYSQPGCRHSLIDRLSAVFSSFDLDAYMVFCSHMRVPHLFSATINHNCLNNTSRYCPVRDGDAPAGNCMPCAPGECPPMGYNLQPSMLTQGSRLYVPDTSGQWPFCLGE